jgi:hypothetical protein
MPLHPLPGWLANSLSTVAMAESYRYGYYVKSNGFCNQAADRNIWQFFY